MTAPVPRVLDRFVPTPDAGARHEITIRAPAGLVLETARNFDIQSIRTIRVLFDVRAKLLRSNPAPQTPRAGLVAQMLGLGWKCLAEEPGRYFVAGAACQPWQGDPGFKPITAQQFVSYEGTDEVKIAWTLEVESLGPELTRFATETRVVACDDEAQKKFRRYWRKFGIGIVMVRKLLLPALRREAERRWRSVSI